jgi:hypothetical protein
MGASSKLSTSCRSSTASPTGAASRECATSKKDGTRSPRRYSTVADGSYSRDTERGWRISSVLSVLFSIALFSGVLPDRDPPVSPATHISSTSLLTAGPTHPQPQHATGGAAAGKPPHPRCVHHRTARRCQAHRRPTRRLPRQRPVVRRVSPDRRRAGGLAGGGHVGRPRGGAGSRVRRSGRGGRRALRRRRRGDHAVRAGRGGDGDGRLRVRALPTGFTRPAGPPLGHGVGPGDGPRGSPRRGRRIGEPARNYPRGSPLPAWSASRTAWKRSAAESFSTARGRARHLRAVGVPAHQQDPFGAESRGGQHRRQPDSAVTDVRGPTRAFTTQ